MTLHLEHVLRAEIRARLDAWEPAVQREAETAAENWRMLVVWSPARDASISGSTGLEGNPLDPQQVELVLSGSAIDADRDHIREVENYNAALVLAREAVARADFAWDHQIVHQVNAAVMRGLPTDTGGDYRGAGEEIHVGIFTGPSSLMVQTLMDEFMVWLRRSRRVPALIRSALVHLNLIAIHPFNDGNGRTARILAAMVLMREGVRAPELISVEAYLRRHRDEYVDILRTTLGMSYDPDNHPVTEWLDFYTRISLDRLEVRNRILDALPTDIGVVHAALADAGEPLDWAAVLLAARVSRLRTARVVSMTGRSAPAARAMMAQMVDAGWLVAIGRTRGRWYQPSDGLAALGLRVPRLMRQAEAGDELSRF